MRQNSLILALLAGVSAAAPSWPEHGGHGHQGPPGHHGPPGYPGHSGYPGHPTGTWSHGYPSATGRPTVTLASGVVVGTTTSVASATATVNKFLGLPFAASPPERFSPPQSPASWHEPLDASELKPACIQQFVYPLATQEFVEAVFNNPAPLESEDCLYLNVFAPSTPYKGEGGRAVLFWIYGGSLQFGYSGIPQYDGSSFAANQDVIVVTTAYRTNVFGFSNSPQIPFGEQNSGFLDQRKALDWVQQNIARFGGSPDKVTIFGESAGGYSVKQLLANPPSPLTYRAAIMESEATAAGDSGLASWDALVANLSCTNAASQIACVRAVPATTIRTIIDQNELIFTPAFDNVTDTRNVAPTISGKTFAKVPFMLGTNSQEGRVFAVGYSNVTTFLDTIIPGFPAYQAEIIAQYPADAGNAYHIVADIITDVVFQCPAMTLADLAVANGYDVWRYYYNASFPNVEPFPDPGVFHSSEIAEVFGTYNRTGATTQQIELSAYMQGAWANFAKDPTAGPGWPMLSADSSTLGDLGGDGANGEYNIAASLVDGPCAVLAPIVAVEGI